MVRVPQPDKPKIWVTVLDLKKNSISCINITMLTQDFPNLRHMDLRENPINCGVVKSISTRALHVISDCYSFNMTSTNSPLTGGRATTTVDTSLSTAGLQFYVSSSASLVPTSLSIAPSVEKQKTLAFIILMIPVATLSLG
ncbi:Hypothetical predicted protein [Paramuricea clavata]|uniref:Uncharacterized protein n=1 Tax=Paramuricea clavata TaxID=317549 RepID=A0A6S7KHX0_PARCT|nr:Hypothetical predicted protein [Paramuricea clavata]